MELDGQLAIVTGAGRGIGRAIALELARLGADVVVAELDKDGAERTAGEVRALGRRAAAVPTDVTSRGSLDAMVERARSEFGRIDVLVNNAGIYRAATVPLGRMERAEDVASVVGFLASDRAGYMTGQALSVDGGLVMQG